eukprot:jgi/Bigna1/78642/fgenesh1_pg.56_\
MLESIAYGTRRALEGVQAGRHGGESKGVREVVVVGGATKSEIFMGIFADVLGVELVTLDSPNAAMLSAAVVASAGLRISAMAKHAISLVYLIGVREKLTVAVAAEFIGTLVEDAIFEIANDVCSLSLQVEIWPKLARSLFVSAVGTLRTRRDMNSTKRCTLTIFQFIRR